MGLDVEFRAKKHRMQHQYDSRYLFEISKSFYPMYKFLENRLKNRNQDKLIEDYGYELSRNDLLCLLEFVINNNFMIENRYSDYWRNRMVEDIKEALLFHHYKWIIAMYISY